MKFLPISLAAASVLILDRLTKFLITKNLAEGQSITVLPNIFHITLVHNSGVAFGLFKGLGPAFILLTLVVIAFILLYIWNHGAAIFPIAMALGLILGGAAGNLIDRLALGYVIDFLDFRIWPVFNAADSAITIGVAILVWNILARKCTPSC